MWPFSRVKGSQVTTEKYYDGIQNLSNKDIKIWCKSFVMYQNVHVILDDMNCTDYKSCRTEKDQVSYPTQNF